LPFQAAVHEPRAGGSRNASVNRLTLARRATAGIRFVVQVSKYGV
jgi:hypothetical protein